MKRGLLVLTAITLAAAASAAEETDPLEPLNRKMLAFNYVLDKAIVEPLAKVYVSVIPGFARTGVRNAINNLREPRTALNQCLQGKFGHAFSDAGRFLVNSTIGLAVRQNYRMTPMPICETPISRGALHRSPTPPRLHSASTHPQRNRAAVERCQGVDARTAFARQGFMDLGAILDADEVAHWRTLFDEDRRRYPYFWHPYGYHQQANYDALVTTPAFDGLIRHPKLLPVVQTVMGGPVCFGEIGLRRMPAYAGEPHQQWHRDRQHRLDHPLRIDYVQLMVYLTDVAEDTHCFSLSPESIDEPILADTTAQLQRGIHDLHGRAGTCALCNAAILHTATTRPTEVERKSVQIYYGHRDRAPLANDSAIPATLWRDHPDAETRSFYGVLNERTRILTSAFARPTP